MRRGAVVPWAVLALGLAAVPARGDVTVERFIRTGGLGGLGASESTTVEKISGLRKREASSVKLTGSLGFLGKMAGEIGTDQITVIPKDVVWRLDHKRRTYTESRITAPPMTGGEGAPGGEEPEKSDVRVVRNEVTVKETGAKKTVNGFACAQYVVSWLVETEDVKTGERGQSTMTMDLWNTPETAEIRALQKEEREFGEAWMKQIGWDVGNAEAQRLGLAMVGGMLGGDPESLEKGAREVAAKLAKIKGYPIVTEIRWQVSGTGDGGEEAAAEEPPPDLPKGLGGLMSALGRRGAPAASPKGGEAKGAVGTGAAFESYTEVRSIATSAIPDGEFAVPAGYKLTR